MSKKEKLKKWCEDHKEGVNEVISVGRFVLFVGVGCIAGSKISTYLTSVGMTRFHELGVIKFFDPDTSLEVTASEAIDVIKRLNNK